MESNRMVKGEVMLVYISELFAWKKTAHWFATLFVLKQLFTHKYQLVNSESFYHELATDWMIQPVSFHASVEINIKFINKSYVYIRFSR